MYQLGELGKGALDVASAGRVVNNFSLWLFGCEAEGVVTFVERRFLSRVDICAIAVGVGRVRLTPISGAIRPIDTVYLVLLAFAKLCRESAKHFESLAQRVWDIRRQKTVHAMGENIYSKVILSFRLK